MLDERLTLPTLTSLQLLPHELMPYLCDMAAPQWHHQLGPCLGPAVHFYSQMYVTGTACR
jgi:hypothetical protein